MAKGIPRNSSIPKTVVPEMVAPSPSWALGAGIVADVDK